MWVTMSQTAWPWSWPLFFHPSPSLCIKLSGNSRNVWPFLLFKNFLFPQTKTRDLVEFIIIWIASCSFYMWYWGNRRHLLICHVSFKLLCFDRSHISLLILVIPFIYFCLPYFLTLHSSEQNFSTASHFKFSHFRLIIRRSRDIQ